MPPSQERNGAMLQCGPYNTNTVRASDTDSLMRKEKSGRRFTEGSRATMLLTGCQRRQYIHHAAKGMREYIGGRDGDE
jgi:hypothetical protein